MSIGFSMNFYKLITIDLMEFSDWITEKFLEWRGDRIGQSASIAEFAKLFCTSQQLMSEWMKKSGKRPTSAKYINNLVEVYGIEVYEALGLNIPGLSPINTERLLAASKELTMIANDRDLEVSDPEFTKLFVEVFSRNGITVQEID